MSSDASANQQSQPLEVDPNTNTTDSDLDSVYESDVSSLTTSLASYVKKTTTLKGRKYDAAGEYITAIDEKSKDQFDFLNEIYFRILGGRLYLAPIVENPQNVLDLGTGTGIWAIQFADEHPSAMVIGTDIVPMQPAWVPPNCQFQIDDYNTEGDWTFKEKFDLVHARTLQATIKDLERWTEQCFKILKPGGWLEIEGEDIELYCDDGTLPPNTPIAVWMENLEKGIHGVAGMKIHIYDEFKEHMTKAGFDMSTYQRTKFPIAIGTWPKKKEEKVMGAMFLANLLMGMEGWSVFIYTKLLGMTDEDVDNLLVQWYADLKNKKQHKYMKLNCIYVQKPLEDLARSEHEVLHHQSD